MEPLPPLWESRRGIAPETLLELVQNTAPFFLEETSWPFAEPLRAFRKDRPKRLSHFHYFELCLSAHYTTVATFVPTDVDNQIRKHLWEVESLPLVVAMAELTLASVNWDFRPVTARWQGDRGGEEVVSGHNGEWFSVAVGAYSALSRWDHPLAGEVKKAIEGEWQRESLLFQSLVEKGDGIGALRASTLLAHNLGDLDRVQDQWQLPPEDPLRRTSYKLGHESSRQPWLKKAGALNKAFMASENHRHYPLRSVRGLRADGELLLPIGPFFHYWGKTVANHPKVEDRTLTETMEALVEGFRKLSSPQVPLHGYARALRGMMETSRGQRAMEELPSKIRKELQKGTLSQSMAPSEDRFLETWAKKALQFLKGL